MHGKHLKLNLITSEEITNHIRGQGYKLYMNQHCNTSKALQKVLFGTQLATYCIFELI